MVVVDTNVIVRFVLKDNMAQAMRAKDLLGSGEKLFIPESVFAEVDFVLRKIYKKDRDAIASVFSFFTHRKNTSFPIQIPKAIELYVQTSNSFVDCVVATHTKDGMLATFDKKLLKQTKVKPYWK